MGNYLKFYCLELRDKLAAKSLAIWPRVYNRSF